MPKNTEGRGGSLTLSSGGLGPSSGRRARWAGLALAGAGAGAVRGAGAVAELPEAGPAAALLLAAVLGQDIVVAAVVTEDAAADPGVEQAWAMRTRLLSHVALPHLGAWPGGLTVSLVRFRLKPS